VVAKDAVQASNLENKPQNNTVNLQVIRLESLRRMLLSTFLGNAPGFLSHLKI
jgi:hypothetical protein